MQVRVAIIGPNDLVKRTAVVAREFAGLVPISFPYRHERETAQLVRQAGGEADAFLFTGPIPYYLAREEGLLDRPAGYVGLTGASLFRALLQVQLDQLGDIKNLSIDTLSRREIEEAYRELGVSTKDVLTKEYAGPVSTHDLVDFHKLGRRTSGATIAITCLLSAYDVLRRHQPVFRLVPTIQSIRVALNTILLRALESLSQNAQVAIVVVRVVRARQHRRRLAVDHRPAARLDVRAALDRDAQALGGPIVQLSKEEFMIITTRGALVQTTGNFSQAPIAGLISRDGPMTVRIGVGLGRSAREAERHARFALPPESDAEGPRCRVAFDTAMIVPLPFPGKRVRLPDNTVMLARRLGVSRATIVRLRALVHARGPELTAHDVADWFRVTTRSGRRILSRLCVHGVAAVSRDNRNGIGRPRRVYRTTV